MAPRLRVCAVQDARSSSAGALLSALKHAGHSGVAVRALTEPAEQSAARQADLLILDSEDPEWVRRSVGALEPLTRPKQMVLHTCLAVGVQILDDVELRGAVTMAAHPVVPEVWVTSAADELGEAAAALLVGEARGIAVPVQDALRPTLLAATRLMALGAAGSGDGVNLLAAALPEAAAALSPYSDAVGADTVVALAPAELERAYEAIGDPSVARFYAELERREAERTRNVDVELWALSKKSGKEK